MTVKMDMFCCQLEMLNVVHVKSFMVLKSTYIDQRFPAADLAKYC